MSTSSKEGRGFVLEETHEGILHTQGPDPTGQQREMKSHRQGKPRANKKNFLVVNWPGITPGSHRVNTVL